MIKRICYLLSSILFLSLGLTILNTYRATRDYRYSSIEPLPAQTVGIVFGAQVRRNGSLSPVLADRVDAAIELYRKQKIKQILMSGDNSSVDYNEVEAMKRYALSKGIPESVITLDHAGFSTYESCYRAKAIFNIAQAVIITQNYHVPRAVYSCRKLGITAIGYGTPDWSRYSDFMLRAQPREFLAQIKAAWQLNITHPLPTYLGNKETLNSN